MLRVIRISTYNGLVDVWEQFQAQQAEGTEIIYGPNGNKPFPNPEHFRRSFSAFRTSCKYNLVGKICLYMNFHEHAYLMSLLLSMHLICVYIGCTLKRSWVRSTLRSEPSLLRSPLRRQGQAPRCSLCSARGWTPSRTWRPLGRNWASPWITGTSTIFLWDRYVQ